MKGGVKWEEKDSTIFVVIYILMSSIKVICYKKVLSDLILKLPDLNV